LSSNLLSTKLFIPEPRQNYIIRPKLIDQLDGALSSKLILVAAPPGYGKTTLLSVWIKERSIPTAWLSLDTGDNDHLLFTRYLISTLQYISPDIGQVSLTLLKSTQASSPTSILSALLNDLTRFEGDIVLVLDDYHIIESQNVHDILTYLLDHLPPNMHIILVSRSDPPLPLSRLRARNQLLEIRQADLRLSPEETGQFLSQSMGLTLSDEQIARLDSRTEGWFAGLQFAGLSLGKQEDQDTFLASFSGSHRYVIDYLADEVYNNQGKDMQVFLSKIAILDRFTAPLCDAITGRQDSQIMLNQLDESNLFLIALDEQRKWYRFHHLFLDSLRVHLGDQPQAELHRLAANWFLENQLYLEAVKHASASGDKEILIAAISSAAKIAFEQGEIGSLSSWLNSLPRQDLMENSQLATFKGMITFFSVNPEEALPYVIAAQENQPDNAPSSQQGQLMSLQAHIGLYQGDLNRSINLSREALEHLDPDDLFFRNLTLNVLGQILEMKSDVAGAVEIYRQAFILSQKTDDQLGTLVIFTNLIFALNELGKRTQALSLCQEFAADPKWSSAPGFDLSDGVHLPWSLLSFEANLLELAFEQINRTLQGLELVNIAQGKLWAQFITGSILLANHNYERLAEVTSQGRMLAERSGSNTVHYAWFDMLDAQADLLRGDLAAVEKWARSRNFTPLDSPHHWFEQQYFTYARLLIAQGNTTEAKQLLNSMLANAEIGQRLRKLITIHLLLALTESVDDKREEMYSHLEIALDLAVPQDYFRAFLDEGQALIDLLSAVRRKAPEFIDRLLAEQGSYSDQSIALIHSYEILSDRENEVLHLVARGYSNREIAAALFVTLGTVKKHLNNIFGKLQVKNRTEAVARARELQLME
jgi:LuxR family maltose regulon positive regulatory protein